MNKSLSTAEILDLFFDCQEILWRAYEELEDKVVFELYLKTSKLLFEMSSGVYRDEGITVH